MLPLSRARLTLQGGSVPALTLITMNATLSLNLFPLMARWNPGAEDGGLHDRTFFVGLHI